MMRYRKSKVPFGERMRSLLVGERCNREIQQPSSTDVLYARQTVRSAKKL
uniref:Uncharacterized protein n=1 Tax=Brassica oleracea var. oleracea TaxID=109376 RepID=A0A0D3AYC9_BRAOL